MINSHIVIYTYSHCNIYTLIVNKNLVLIFNNNMNSLYMENHTSTLYTHLDKLKQVNHIYICTAKSTTHLSSNGIKIKKLSQSKNLRFLYF